MGGYRRNCNRLTHGYSDIDLDRVWDTVLKDLKPLCVELGKTLLTENRTFYLRQFSEAYSRKLSLPSSGKP
jgi:hypothetical protein